MPYKTKYGSHYHMTYGCHGATISCDAAGLTPCSDCCGADAEAAEGGTPKGAATGSGSRTPTGPSGAGSLDATLIPSAPASDEQHVAEVILAVQPTMGDAVATLPGPEDIDEEEFQRRLAEYADMFEGRDIYIWSGLEPTPALPRDPNEWKIPEMDKSGKISWDPSADLSESETQAIESGNACAKRLAKTLRKRGVERDDESKAKVSFVLRIEEAAGEIPDSDMRELMRLSAQRTWNAMHPESPVLEWTRSSDTYADDSPLAVMQGIGIRDEDTRLVTYSIYSKSNGEDITMTVTSAIAEARASQAKMDRILDEGRKRAHEEEIRRERRMFSDWLSSSSGRRSRYFAASPEAKRRMMRRCWEDYGYRRRPDVPHLTEEEYERLHELQETHEWDEKRLDRVIRQYGLTDDMVRLAGKTTDEVFRRRPKPKDD